MTGTETACFTSRMVVPALAYLHRHRYGHGPGHCGYYLRGELRRAHEGGAVAGFDDFADGAAHVDVYYLGPGDVERAPSALGHGLRFVAEDLGRDGPAELRHVQQRGGLAVIIAQSLGADHLGVNERRALLKTEPAEGRVRDARHGRQHGPARKVERAYGKARAHLRSSPTGQWSEPIISGQM